nr:hypothetical protein [Tanacetum cinerariifolium]
MGDEHLNTIPAAESDKFIKSCVENLVPNPSESEGENGCDVLACFTTFSNVLFDADYDSDSSDDQSFSDEDVPEKIYSNPLFDEEIIPMEIDHHSFNAESVLIESMPNHDSLITISSKIDSLFDEFAGEFTLLKSIPPGIDDTDCHPEKEIRLTKRLLYDNSSPCPPKEIVSDNSNSDIESFSPSPIPIKDSDPLMEEIDLSFNPDDPMPPSIEEDDDGSKRDIPILKELLDNYSLSLPNNESYHFDIPLPYRPPAKPPDGTVEDKILVPKPPKNCARCTRCGYLVDGPNCQVCALLHQELEENLVIHSPDFQNYFEPSNASTNVVNAPREPYVVKLDNGSSVDEIIFDLKRAPESPNQFQCFHCKDVLRDGEAIDEIDCHPEKEIHLTKRLLYDNSSPRPPKEIVSDNSKADIESFSPSPILIKDSDPLMEEIDLSFNPDDPMPPSIEEDDDGSERDIPILEELLDNYSLSLPNNESYHFDIPSPYHPPAKPPDGNTGTLNIKMLGDVSDQKVPIPNLTITRVLNQEKSPDLLSHLGLEAFQHPAECPMIINGKNIPLLDVPLFYFYPP